MYNHTEFSERLISGTSDISVEFAKNTSSDDVIKFIDILKSHPHSLPTLKLSFSGCNRIRDKGATALAEILSLPNGGNGISIDLSATGVSSESCIAFTEALASGKSKGKISLSFHSNNWQGNTFINALVEALTFGNFPSDVSINIAGNSIDTAGAKALAQALTSENCAENLHLNLEHTKLGDTGRKIIFDALGSGKSSTGLTLSLWDAKFKSQEVIEMANLLASGQCPPRLKIILSGHHLNDAEVAALQSALETNNCPPSLGLEFSSQTNLSIAKHLYFEVQKHNFRKNELPYFIFLQGIFGEQPDNFYFKNLPRDLIKIIGLLVLSYTSDPNAIEDNIHKKITTIYQDKQRFFSPPNTSVLEKLQQNLEKLSTEATTQPEVVATKINGISKLIENYKISEATTNPDEKTYKNLTLFEDMQLTHEGILTEEIRQKYLPKTEERQEKCSIM